MAASTVVLRTLVFATIAVFGWRLRRLARAMSVSAPAARFDNPSERLRGVLCALLHQRLLNNRYSGVLHALIFSGFVVLLTAIAQSFGSVMFPGFSLRPVGGATWIAWLQDVFAVLLILGVAMAVWQRSVIRPERFKGSNALDAFLIYVLILTVIVSMLLEAGFRIAAGDAALGAWKPVSQGVADLLGAMGVSAPAAASGQSVAYWAHICAVLVFLLYIPGSKHRHMFLAAPNLYFRSLAPKGRLPGAPAPQAADAANGDEGVRQLTWKDMLDVATCTECGRCQAACPAYAAGLPLSPKILVTNLRDEVIATAGDASDRPLAGGVIQETTLWACTTCRACMEVCPVHIEHIPKIVMLRRRLIERGEVEPMLREALSNLQRSGNSMGKSARARALWTKNLPFKIKDARRESVDVLWFVGDFASYDVRVQEQTRKIATLLHVAGVDFGILYDSERNSGNDARRAGDEGLFELLAQHNIEVLSACRFQRIMTSDPHSFNALSHEYATLGAHYRVLHHSTLLLELVESGRLRPRAASGEVVTYHDPCYLGRYNGGYEAPRRLIEHAGYRLHEMARCRENALCCCAGGGRIWMDDGASAERPSESRIKEALALGDVRAFVVACPKDKVMYASAVQALGVADRIEVRDLADLIELEADARSTEPGAILRTGRNTGKGVLPPLKA
jgi:Fe-S oxidoreductase